MKQADLDRNEIIDRDEVLKMARKAGIIFGYPAYHDRIEVFAKLVADVATAKEREAWRNAAIRVGENLATCGPAGYYDFTAQQWLDWALDATTKMQDDYMNLGACGEREACAKLCERDAAAWGYDSNGASCAIAIRARGQ